MSILLLLGQICFCRIISGQNFVPSFGTNLKTLDQFRDGSQSVQQNFDPVPPGLGMISGSEYSSKPSESVSPSVPLPFPLPPIPRFEKAVRSKNLMSFQNSMKEDLRCAESFKLWNKKCYHAGNIKLQYKEAALYCKALQSTLVSIHSGEENKFVKEISKFKKFWIGLRKNNGEHWSWTDKSPLNFKQWGIMQPDGCCGSNVKCAILDNVFLKSEWFDVSCATTHGFICKYDPQVNKPPKSSLRSLSIPNMPSSNRKDPEYPKMSLSSSSSLPQLLSPYDPGIMLPRPRIIQKIIRLPEIPTSVEIPKQFQLPNQLSKKRTLIAPSDSSFDIDSSMGGNQILTSPPPFQSPIQLYSPPASSPHAFNFRKSVQPLSSGIAEPSPVLNFPSLPKPQFSVPLQQQSEEVRGLSAQPPLHPVKPQLTYMQSPSLLKGQQTANLQPSLLPGEQPLENLRPEALEQRHENLQPSTQYKKRPPTVIYVPSQPAEQRHENLLPLSQHVQKRPRVSYEPPQHPEKRYEHLYPLSQHIKKQPTDPYVPLQPVEQRYKNIHPPSQHTRGQPADSYVPSHSARQQSAASKLLSETHRLSQQPQTPPEDPQIAFRPLISPYTKISLHISPLLSTPIAPLIFHQPENVSSIPVTNPPFLSENEPTFTKKQKQCECPDGWSLFEHNCLKVFKSVKVMPNDKASLACQKQQAHLAAPCFPSFKSFVEEMVKDTVKDPIHNVRYGGCYKNADKPGESCCRANWRFTFKNKNTQRASPMYDTYSWEYDTSARKLSVYVCEKSCRSVDE